MSNPIPQTQLNETIIKTLVDDHNSLVAVSSSLANDVPFLDGSKDFTGTIGGVEGVDSTDFVTKGQLDAAIQGVDWQDSVISVLNTPPTSPTVGQRYLIGTSPTGTWVIHANEIVTWGGSYWIYMSPNKGMTLNVESTGENLTYNGSAWVNMGSAISHSALLNLGSDDHLQYLTNARGDARYPSLSSFNAANVTLNNHVANTSNPHNTTAAQVGAVSNNAFISSSGGISISGGPSEFLSNNPVLKINAANQTIVVGPGSIEVGVIDTPNIFTGSVTTEKLANNAVTTDKINAFSVTNNKLALNSVGTNNIIDEAVTPEKLIDDAVSTIKIQNSAVTNPKLALNSVSTDRIQDGAITPAKLSTSYVPSARNITTTAPLTGGHDLGADVILSLNQGAGSTLDADLLDGQHGAFYQDASNLNTGTIGDARLPSRIDFRARYASTDYNANTNSGWYSMDITGATNGPPVGDFYLLQSIKGEGTNDGILQIATSTTTGRVWRRQFDYTSTWSAWSELIDTQAKQGALWAPLSHVGSNGSSHAAVTTSTNGFMLAADKARLNAIYSGTYIPVASNISSNTTVVTPSLATYTRIGDIVSVTGQVGIRVTASGTRFDFELSIPAAVTFANTTQASGLLASYAIGATDGASAGNITSISATNRIQVLGYSSAAGATSIYGYHFQYTL